MKSDLRNTAARVLVIAPTAERIAAASAFLVSMVSREAVCVLGEDRPQGKRAIVGTVDQARKDLRYMGVIDEIVADDCLNLAPFTNGKKWREILDALQSRNRSIIISVIQPKSLIGGNITLPPATWACGSPLSLKFDVSGIKIESPNVQPCGHMNLIEHFFCRSCGRFRGF